MNSSFHLPTGLRVGEEIQVPTLPIGSGTGTISGLFETLFATGENLVPEPPLQNEKTVARQVPGTSGLPRGFSPTYQRPGACEGRKTVFPTPRSRQYRQRRSFPAARGRGLHWPLLQRADR